MEEKNTSLSHHTMIEDMLRRAISGDISAANNMLNYLNSAYPALKQSMQEAINDHTDARIWMRLLQWLALHTWNDHLECERQTTPIASERVDKSIEEVFLHDKGDLNKRRKETTLLSSLDDSRSQIRQFAAYLLGMRGNPHAIRMLTETIETGSKESQLRAIHALETIGSERCGPPLLKALIMDRGKVHREAGRALNRLGKLVESTWLKALDHPDDHIRWHAARGLGNIGDARHAQILAKGLMDENRIVRWATADVLAHLGARGVPATLQILSYTDLNEQTRQAAYHALHAITSREVQTRLKPLLDAMHDPSANVKVPGIAQRLLLEWERVE